MRGTSLRLLSAVAAKSNMRTRRWDFVAAYLHKENYSKQAKWYTAYLRRAKDTRLSAKTA